MNRNGWICIIASLLVLVGGTIGVVQIHNEVPKRLINAPLLAQPTADESETAGADKTLKDIIFATQKLVVMIETDNGLIGSGFLYNDQGDLITNGHVVIGAHAVKVRTADARELEGTVIGIGTDVDVAVVRVPELAGTKPLEMETEHVGEIGDEVIAIGSPLGYQNTVTTGIISGVGRELNIDPYVYKDMYQISAPIAHGNSGGPLVDRETGAVLGINSAGAEQGAIGFSIPIGQVLSLVEGWSASPMTELPSNIAMDSDIFQEGAVGDVTFEDMASYLVTHFYDSLNSGDYVYAYSLIGSTWTASTSYEKFREGYIGTKNITIDDISVQVQEDETAVVTARITAQERVDGAFTDTPYKVVYTVGYENDQLKLLSGKGQRIENK
ncbi:trypsin-like peptidase [Paenibacillus cellulosilyticus]|uniref:Trypsin-like peptidase n=1 Tax=Paenibacillus cellulosilyticus TaxID=375489 RepID=A0A2V2YPW3_9BACL|nr:trypsin-like peptidase domain-containing protein [Paenibacillus cellulosilyticus]PWV97963.1 trypsin-like peptidase [Paenibacillus cellulosilyticus]QKS44006.1 trypsin-like peptidase domain-containing protein [Paenibacillus cellulosilyticus]